MELEEAFEKSSIGAAKREEKDCRVIIRNLPNNQGVFMCRWKLIRNNGRKQLVEQIYPHLGALLNDAMKNIYSEVKRYAKDWQPAQEIDDGIPDTWSIWRVHYELPTNAFMRIYKSSKEGQWEEQFDIDYADRSEAISLAEDLQKAFRGKYTFLIHSAIYQPDSMPTVIFDENFVDNLDELEPEYEEIDGFEDMEASYEAEEELTESARQDYDEYRRDYFDTFSEYSAYDSYEGEPLEGYSDEDDLYEDDL